MGRSLISLEAGLTPPPGEWCRRGSCRSYPTMWWYPFASERTHKELKDDAAVAIRICREICPVRPQCLSHAMRYGEAGIWGGTSEEERRDLKRGKPSVERQYRRQALN